MNGAPPPASWNMYHGEKSAAVLLVRLLESRYMRWDVNEQEVYEFDPNHGHEGAREKT